MCVDDGLQLDIFLIDQVLKHGSHSGRVVSSIVVLIGTEMFQTLVDLLGR